MIVLWNTLYIDAALQQLRAEGFPVLPEDAARLSPLVYEHINLLGRYAFSVPEAVQRGELRPLRNSSEAIDFPHLLSSRRFRCRLATIRPEQATTPWRTVQFKRICSERGYF
jgi:hypothetical protein